MLRVRFRLRWLMAGDALMALTLWGLTLRRLSVEHAADAARCRRAVENLSRGPYVPHNASPTERDAIIKAFDRRTIPLRAYNLELAEKFEPAARYPWLDSVPAEPQ